MHGQAKVKSTDAEKEKKRKERQAQVLAYRQGMEKAFEKRKKKELDDEALEITGNLLSSNPDIYTLWNFRKEILVQFKENKTKEVLAQILASELKLTEGCLKVNPKSYGAWHHRLWLLDNLPDPDLNRELELCTKYLKLDERNFHCWDYRRAVVSRLGVAPEKELEYTFDKIEENFSNYSSWHYRSKLLPNVHPDPTGSRPIDESTQKNELELVQNAAFTDPEDSSAWFYQRWLLGGCTGGRSGSEVSLVAAWLSPCRKKLCLAFSRPILAPPTCGLCLHGLPDGTWTPIGSSHASNVWGKELNEELAEEGSENVILGVGSGSSREEAMLGLESDGTYSWITDKPEFGTQFSPALTNTLTEQLDSCQQLLKLEPDSKWTLLTSTLLMQAIDRKQFKEETLECLKSLKKIDYLRAAYYSDLRSRYQIEYAIEEQCMDLKQEFRIIDAELTALYHTQYLLTTMKVDLSGNMLGRALPRLNTLQLCQVLVLDRNELTTLKGLPPLSSLHTLSVRHNKIRSWTEGVIPYIKNCPKLTRLDVTGNPVERTDKGIEELVQSLASLVIVHE